MNNTSPDVVRIGVGLARVTRVTPKQVEYLDEAGQQRSVDLEECARNWNRYHDDNRNEFVPLTNAPPESVARWNAGCVGQRGALDDPPWVELMSERGTRFEFMTYDEIYVQLLGPLMESGWYTFDTN